MAGRWHEMAGRHVVKEMAGSGEKEREVLEHKYLSSNVDIFVQ